MGEYFQSHSFIKSLEITAITGLLGSFFAVSLGTYFARRFALFQWRLKRTQRLLLLLPYLIPNFVLAIAYVLTWNPTTGLLNAWLPLPFSLYGMSGMILLFGIVHLPVAFLMLENKFERLDSSLREAAVLSGANTFELIWKIELPLLKPTLLSAFGLCFALNISAFAIPAWIGAPEKVYPLTYKIYQSVSLGGATGLSQAAWISLVLFFLAVPSLILNALTQRNEKRYITLSGKSSRKNELELSGSSFIFFQIIFVMSQAVFWVIPLTTLFVSTLVKPGCLQQAGLSCLRDASLHSYSYVLFELSETRDALKGSLLYGGASALLILVLCVLTLILFSKSPRLLRTVEWIFGIPVVTPGAIIAIGLIVLFSGSSWLNLYNTPWIVVLAYILKHFNLAFQSIRTGYMNLSQSLIEAARISGASTLKIWIKIILPILKSDCLGSFFLVLIPILGELTMSVFLTSPSFRSIGTVLFDLQDYSDQASAGALSILLILMILTLNQTARALSRGKLGY